MFRNGQLIEAEDQLQKILGQEWNHFGHPEPNTKTELQAYAHTVLAAIESQLGNTSSASEQLALAKETFSSTSSDDVGIIDMIAEVELSPESKQATNVK